MTFLLRYIATQFSVFTSQARSVDWALRTNKMTFVISPSDLMWFIFVGLSQIQFLLIRNKNTW